MQLYDAATLQQLNLVLVIRNQPIQSDMRICWP